MDDESSPKKTSHHTNYPTMQRLIIQDPYQTAFQNSNIQSPIILIPPTNYPQEEVYHTHHFRSDMDCDYDNTANCHISNSIDDSSVTKLVTFHSSHSSGAQPPMQLHQSPSFLTPPANQVINSTYHSTDVDEQFHQHLLHNQSLQHCQPLPQQQLITLTNSHSQLIATKYPPSPSQHQQPQGCNVQYTHPIIVPDFPRTIRDSPHGASHNNTHSDKTDNHAPNPYFTTKNMSYVIQHNFPWLNGPSTRNHLHHLSTLPITTNAHPQTHYNAPKHQQFPQQQHRVSQQQSQQHQYLPIHQHHTFSPARTPSHCNASTPVSASTGSYSDLVHSNDLDVLHPNKKLKPLHTPIPVSLPQDSMVNNAYTYSNNTANPNKLVTLSHVAVVCSPYALAQSVPNPNKRGRSDAMLTPTPPSHLTCDSPLSVNTKY